MTYWWKVKVKQKNMHTNFLDVCFEVMQEENILLILLEQKYSKHENNEVELTVWEQLVY